MEAKENDETTDNCSWSALELAAGATAISSAESGARGLFFWKRAHGLVV